MKIIRSLDKIKSASLYSIPCQILESITDEISEVLVKIYNLSIECGIFPELLKTVKVVLIFKNKGSPLHSSKYRPISLATFKHRKHFWKGNTFKNDDISEKQ